MAMHKTYLQVAVPSGIGDSVWSLMKLQSILAAEGKDRATVAVCGGGPPRAGEFVSRFSFVDSAWYCQWTTVEDDFTTPDGVYNHAPSQRNWHNQFDWLLVANQHLEYGRRLEDWLPDYAINWDVADCYEFTDDELAYAVRLRSRIGRFVVFYAGPLDGNTKNGHNRGGLWTPDDWRQCYDWAYESGFEVIVVGADYDRSYWDLLRPLMPRAHDAIGRWNISRTFAVIKQSECVLAYQSGVGIFATLLGVPTAMFWREHGNSIMADHRVTFSEDMATAWVPPAMLDRGDFTPLIYGRHHAEHAIESMAGF